MQTTTILFILLAFLLSLSIAYYQYFYASKDTGSRKIFLSSLRTLSVFLLLLLLINPAVRKTVIENTKPVMAVLIDDSASTSFFKEEEKVASILQELEADVQLNAKFEMAYFTFGKEVKVKDSLTFDAPVTAISKGITAINKLYKNKKGAIVLLSDGNQTTGNDYEFVSSKMPIATIVLGDTVNYRDLRIRQLNVNKYSYLNHQFPVEVHLFYEGSVPISTEFRIEKKGKAIFKQRIRFSASEKSKIIRTQLTSTSEGINFYKASIEAFGVEKNTKNNTKDFSVEVIDEQTKIALVSSVLHPDLGALKRSIERNKQRKVDVFYINNIDIQLNDYQLLIMYQPNNKFNDLLKKVRAVKSNYLVISGANTDWGFLNKQQLGFTKKAIDQTESYSANYQSSFQPFLQKDIGFNNFPPLKDQFGEVFLSKENHVLLQQRVFGIASEQPLLATFEQNDQKSAVILGEGIWKWRAANFIQSNSFQDFDEFTGNLIQYLVSNSNRKQLEVGVEGLYLSNAPIRISAFYTDKNYQFDPRASLLLSVTNTITKEQRKFPFSLALNSFQVVVEGLSPGSYTYTVSVAGHKSVRSGVFLTSEARIEEQFTNANTTKLNRLANSTGGKLYYPIEISGLIEDFVGNADYTTLQKSTLKNQALIDWKWMLFLILILLAIEWFTRKYYGKI
ncbi:MAG: Uncharacterised protein [Polaribacter sp. SA4-10]|nr:MAG: Uncharacterised protein [Polaribacter sp. SA4-10]